MSGFMHKLHFQQFFSLSQSGLCSEQIKKQEFIFVKISLSLLNSSQFCDSSQDLVGHLQELLQHFYCYNIVKNCKTGDKTWKTNMTNV